MCFQGTTARTSSTVTQSKPAPTMPDRHELRGHVRKWARAAKKADPTLQNKHYISDIARDLTNKVAPIATHGVDMSKRVTDRFRKLIEESVLFKRDSICGDARIQINPNAKL